MDDERRRDAPFVREMLVATKRRVRERRPVLAEKDSRTAAAGILAFSERRAGPLGVATVVGQQHDDRVVQLATFFESFDQRADALIEPVDHRRIDRHDVVEVILVLVAERVPLRHIGGSGESGHLGSTSPISICRLWRSSRSLSQPTIYLPRYSATSLAGTISGK